MSSQHEVTLKHQLVTKLLARDKFTSPVDIQKEVTKKFGTGISRVDIARIRMNNHGIKLGPGGYAHSKSGQRVKEVTRPSPPSAAAQASADRLGKLIGELQAEMKMQHVSTLTVPVSGPVEAVQTVRRTIAVSA